ncbi:PH domain-containing protein [Candidatus Peregrinibacteria bacterium]|nr:PH domain-containing protein [Candidatus Peregrinibacteria bacterium]
MEKEGNFTFEKSYKVRMSIVPLIVKILILEIFLALLRFILKILTSPSGQVQLEFDFALYFLIFFIIINIIFLFYFFLSWYYRYFIISPEEVSLNSGIIFRRTDNIDMATIRSVKVAQGIFGRIFKFGTLKLEGPMIKGIKILRSLPNPFRHASLIEKARINAINKSPETIIPHETFSSK